MRENAESNYYADYDYEYEEETDNMNDITEKESKGKTSYVNTSRLVSLEKSQPVVKETNYILKSNIYNNNIDSRNETQKPPDKRAQSSVIVTRVDRERPNIVQLPISSTIRTQFDVESAIKALVEKGKRPPKEFHQQVYHALQSESLAALEREDYDAASRYEAAKQFLGSLSDVEVITSRQTKRKESRIGRLQQAQNELSKQKKEWEGIFQTFWKEQNELRRAFESKRQKEQADFEAFWDSQEAFIPFNKPSPQLLQLRKVQKALALSKSFDQAKVVKMQADEIQKRETQEAEKRALEAMTNAQRALEQKQQKEYECFMEKERRTENFLKSEREKALKPIEMLIHQLSCNTESSNNANPISILTARAKNPRNDCSIPPITPRTSRAYHEFKANDEPIRLTISASNVKKAFEKQRPKTNIQLRKTSK